ncbi:MAG TPA: protein kinase [Polyangiales bacterium]|nr:protein kinase [Polyangiales bacterium]
MVTAVQPGKTLDGGKYRIVRLIAEGGMGAVYEAEHTIMKKRVAIKWIRPGQSSRARATDRLLQEARAASRIHHPHVVDIYDVLREGDAVYLVMEYLDGEPLSALLKRGNLPMHKLIALLLPAMRGVAAAHRKGVVHRDIKPDNIYLARVEDAAQPLCKVLDFGVSKLAPREDEPQALTRSGGAVGTPLYMAVEQLRAKRDIDGRADVYAFGVILYEALTGQLPYTAESFAELVVKVLTTDFVAPRQLNRDIPGPLDSIIRWALAREAKDRIQTLDALIEELEPFATESGFRADMETAEIPSIPAPAPRHATQSDSFAHGSTVLASGLRGSKHLGSRAPRARQLALAMLITCTSVGVALAMRHDDRAASEQTASLPTARAEQAPTAPIASLPTPELEVAPPPREESPEAPRPRPIKARKRVKAEPEPVVIAPTSEPAAPEPKRTRLEQLPVAADFY